MRIFREIRVIGYCEQIWWGCSHVTQEKELELSTGSNDDLLADLAIPGPKHSVASTMLTLSFTFLKTMVAIQPLSLGRADGKLGTILFGPGFAMDKMPGPVCCRMKFSSSNFSPLMDLLPVSSWHITSPLWQMDPGIIL